jgi:tetratricopeptide (TPR) repeat protein
MTPEIDDARAQARAQLEAGEYRPALETAVTALAGAPDDVELLVLAGRAGVELDSPEATGQLRRATELAPQDAGAWHHLGEALAADGETAEADAAFRRAVELDPDDQIALTHLGHTSLAAGRDQEGVGYLARAAESLHGASTASISLVDMYRTFGQFEEALAQARRIFEAAPEDVLALLDVAELSLATGAFEEALAAFDRLRELDDVPGHEAYPIHGLLAVEIRRAGWERAKGLALQAAAIDPQGLSTDVTAFLEAQTGNPGEEPAPTGAEVEAALSGSLSEYRRMHADDRRLNVGDLLV